jgi:hypothetical protein
MTLPTLTCVGPPVFAAPDWVQRRQEEALSGTDGQTEGAWERTAELCLHKSDEADQASPVQSSRQLTFCPARAFECPRRDALWCRTADIWRGQCRGDWGRRSLQRRTGAKRDWQDEVGRSREQELGRLQRELRICVAS